MPTDAHDVALEGEALCGECDRHRTLDQVLVLDDQVVCVPCAIRERMVDEVACLACGDVVPVETADEDSGLCTPCEASERAYDAADSAW